MRACTPRCRSGAHTSEIEVSHQPTSGKWRQGLQDLISDTTGGDDAVKQAAYVSDCVVDAPLQIGLSRDAKRTVMGPTTVGC